MKITAWAIEWNPGWNSKLTDENHESHASLAIQQDTVFRKKERELKKVWGCSSVLEHLASTVKAGGPALNTNKTITKTWEKSFDNSCSEISF